MQRNSAGWIVLAGFSVCSLALAIGCTNSPPPEKKLQYGNPLAGRVSYKGEPIPYGLVVFYNPLVSTNHKTGKVSPVATAMIKQGTYQAENLPAGPVLICLFTDPDLSLTDALKPTMMGLPTGMHMGKGRPKGIILGPPDKGEGPPPRPEKDGPPPLPEPPPADKEGEEFKGLKKGMKGGPKGLPFAKDLTDEQKELLREIHSKYGSLSRPSIAHVIKPGEQVFDILLPMVAEPVQETETEKK
jgi:hypothetical protein